MAELGAAPRTRLQIDDPTSPTASALLRTHIAWTSSTSPPESMFALGAEALTSPDITFWTLWQGGEAVGCCALRELDPTHGEVKSMHVLQARRGQGLADQLVDKLITEASQRGYRRLSLETGSTDEFIPARKLYARHGFVPRDRFADYPEDPLSAYMTREIEAGLPRLAFQTIELGDVGSTNDEVRERLIDVAAGPLVVRGARQLSGRGRRGRNWVSPEGNLYNSFGFVPDKPLATLPELSFVAALAVCDMARSFVDEPGNVRCKWPNDVLHDGAKLSGILLETALTPDQMQAVIIGIGVNIASAPADTPYPAAALANHSQSISVDLAFRTLAATLGDWIAVWQREGFAPIRAAWLDRVDGLGKAIIARLPDKELHGRFAGLADDGALMLETGGGDVVRIAAGDIFCPTDT